MAGRYPPELEAIRGDIENGIGAVGVAMVILDDIAQVVGQNSGNPSTIAFVKAELFKATKYLVASQNSQAEAINKLMNRKNHA